jgi:GH25 family lysozyme M1 (1,4-beta-N-acetylmuramidase)
MNRAKGIDMSKWDDFFRPHTAIQKIDFVIQRASYGLNRDEKFDELFIGVQNFKLRGAYHYMSSKRPWKDQANKFLDVVRGKGFLFYVCDYESFDNEFSLNFAEDTRRWIDHVSSQTGRPVLLYTNPSIYTSFLTPFGTWMNNTNLWIAQYPFTTPNPDEANPFLPPARKSWTIWQYTDKGKGTDYGLARAGAADLNVYNGTVEAMCQWLGVDATGLVVEEEEETGAAEVVTVVETYPGKTNQDMINFIFAAASAVTLEPWEWVTRAKLEHLVVPPENRLKPYVGPHIADLPGLTASEKKAIEAAMKGQPIITQPKQPTYPGISNQNIIDMIYRAAAPFTTDPWKDWIVRAGLEYLAVPSSNRNKPYTGPKIKDLAGLTNGEKQAILGQF